MNFRNRLFILIGSVAALVLLVGIVFWLRREPTAIPVVVEEPAIERERIAPEPSSAAQVDATIQPTTDTAEQPAVVSTDNAVQVAATRRMYMAHMPLRAPELADPDSEANREILERMVTKALARRSVTANASTTPGN